MHGNKLTSFIFCKAWASGTDPGPQTLTSSARARSCQSGCKASNIKHHVAVTAVVSWPAKYIVLQLSTMNLSISSLSLLLLSLFLLSLWLCWWCWWPPLTLFRMASNRFLHFFLSSSSCSCWCSLLFSFTTFKMREWISLLNFHTSLFLFVGSCLHNIYFTYANYLFINMLFFYWINNW